jgi:hypothetical protein
MLHGMPGQAGQAGQAAAARLTSVLELIQEQLDEAGQTLASFEEARKGRCH